MRLFALESTEHRRAYAELRESLGRDGFIEHIWLERDKAQPSSPSTGKYPIKFGPQRAVPPLSAQASNIQPIRKRAKP